MADRPAGVLPYGYLSVSLQDIDGQEVQRRYEIKDTASDADCIALADDLQATTQLTVKDVQLTRRLTGFTATAPEVNSSVAETATVAVEMADGRGYSFNMPALKAALKNGKQVIGTNAALLSFLEWFDDGAGLLNVVGSFYVSDGQEISEAFHEDGKVTGVVNK